MRVWQSNRRSATIDTRRSSISGIIVHYPWHFSTHLQEKIEPGIDFGHF